MPRRQPSDRLPTLLLMLVLAACAVSESRLTAIQSPGVDFYQFWVVPQAARRGDVDVYAAADRERIGREFLARSRAAGASQRQRAAAQQRPVLDTWSTPWLYTLVGLLSGGDYDADYNRFQFVSLMLGALAIAAIARALGYPATGVLGAVAVLAYWFRPFDSDVRVGNVGRLQLAALALWIWLMRRGGGRFREFIGATVLGAAVTLKPTLAPAAAFLALSAAFHRRFAKLSAMAGGMALGTVASAAASAVYFGSARSWTRWAYAMPELLGRGARGVEEGNFSLTRMLIDLARVDLGNVLPAATALIGVACLWASARRAATTAAPRDDSGGVHPVLHEDVPAIGLGVLVLLIGSSLSFMHYFVLAIPTALHLLRPRTGPCAAADGGDAAEPAAEPPSRGAAIRQVLAAATLCLMCIKPPVRLFDLSPTHHFALQFCIAAPLLAALTIREMFFHRQASHLPTSHAPINPTPVSAAPVSPETTSGHSCLRGNDESQGF